MFTTRLVAGALLLVFRLYADDGHAAWLRYAPVDHASVPAVVSVAGESLMVQLAADELVRGLRGMTGRTPRLARGMPTENAIIIGTFPDVHRIQPHCNLAADLKPEGYQLKTCSTAGRTFTLIAGYDERGVLYGSFAFLRKVAAGSSVAALDERQSPFAPIRWINQWDNLDGSIERGYGGRSIFWEDNHVRADLSRVAELGRLLASVGINATTIDNVNADKRLLSQEFVPQIARIAEALRPWGVRVAVSVDFGSPQTLGGLDTFDPLDPRVAAWWKARADALYAAVPDLAGFVLKADSEGRVGPSAYKRSHADAANVVARALKPHGGLLLYRGFVYDHHMDWNNPKNDRARAAYDNFKPLDGQFDDNVVVQIKNGPIDFQVREPASPLFGALEKTNTAVELQVAQEYMGQAKHTVFLVPQWKQAVDFAVATGKTFHRATGGVVGVTNVGLDANWLGNHLSQANLYGFGRLAWNPALSAEAIVQEWTAMTFGSDPKLMAAIDSIQLTSRRTYENYTGPLGLQTLTDIVGDHYGVSVEASEANGWGQWHRADAMGVGMDRTAQTGTGYAGQYKPAVARMYESFATCPDDLLLFFHHVPYRFRLHSGKTVIQTIYDLHYAGAEAVDGYVKQWRALRGLMDDERYFDVLKQFEYQAGQAVVWRDAVVNWFLRASKIPDATGRAGHHPYRVEAEAMKLVGYIAQSITPWEAASNGQAVTCPSAVCSASYVYTGKPGWFTLLLEYFDQPRAVAQFRLRVGEQVIDSWDASAQNPARKMDASSSSRRRTAGVALRTGDLITIEGVPTAGDPAAIDYLEILPE